MSFLGNALNQIGGNPFSTAVGSKIEQATDDSLASENWTLNMEICDLVNETDDGPRDAVKAIRKRLVQNAGKNYTVVMYALTVLETCVKNCGRRFHVLVCNRDFVNELVKLIGPKNDPPTAVQEKVLSLIQSWADAFRNQQDCNGVLQVYQELMAKGIEFPPTDLDAMAPIHTPQRSVEPEARAAPIQQAVDASVLMTSPMLDQSPSSSVSLSSDQRAKIRSELDVLQGNMIVLSEMLSEMKPGEEQPDELELIHELYVTCQSMQERLMDLIAKLSNDDLTADLLRINDDLNNLFLRYSRWEKNREGLRGGSGAPNATAILAKSIPAKPKAPQSDSLIDLDDYLPDQLSKLNTGSSASSQLSKIDTVTARTADQQQSHDDFDMFAQSRNATYENSKSRTSYEDNLNPNQLKGGLSTAAAQAKQNRSPELEFDEMANWLGETTEGEETVTSSEFERFLAERAAAADQLPSVAGSTNGGATVNPRNPPKSKDENQLYAL